MNLRRLFTTRRQYLNTSTSANTITCRSMSFKTWLLCSVFIAVYLLSGSAFAQSQLGNSNSPTNTLTDIRLERYSTIVDILDESMFEFTNRPERSRERLALAKETFDLIRQGSGTSGGLIQGLDSTFARADTAITNQSIADFEIQTNLILGGLQRFLYETATREAQNDNLPLATEYVKRIVQTSVIADSEKMRLSQAADAGALQAALELAAGQSINNHLDLAMQALSQQTLDERAFESAYVSLANAYSGFVTVQDSLSMPPSVAPSLIEAIDVVVAQNPRAAQSVEVLQNDVASYIQFNESVLQQFNADLYGNQGAQVGTGVVGAGAANQPDSIQAAVAQELARQSQPAQGLNNQSANQGLNGLNGQQGQQQLQQQVQQQGQQQGLGLQPRGQQEAGSGVVTLGAPSLGAPSLNSNSRGNVGLANNQNNGGLSLPGTQQNQQANRLGQQGATGLSIGQTNGVNGQTNRLSSASSLNRSTSGMSNQSRVAPEPTFLEGLWNGLPKGIVMLLLAIASFIPLYFLQLAFGSGGPHWVWVRSAIFLLLLPLIIQGIASFGSALGSMTGISALSMLEPFSVTGGVIGQMIWALTSLLGIGLLSYGLWGVCQQLGVVGQGSEANAAFSSSKDDAAANDNDADIDADMESQRSAMTERFTLEAGSVGTVMDMGNETVIDWEDEF